MSDLDKLRAFAQAVMKSWGCEIDAPELQELAEQHGLMVACPVDAPCHEDGCACAEVGFPTYCYRKTPLLTGPKNER